MRRLETAVIFLFLALAACDDGLDPLGRSLLDPERERRLPPAEVIARLRLARDAVVADLGAGPGFLTLPLARALPAGKVIATDVNPRYLRVVARRARAAGLANVATRTVPRDAPGLDDASVDVALLCQVDHLLADRVAYLRALARALRPGGRVAIVNDVLDLPAARAALRAAGFDAAPETLLPPERRYFLVTAAASRR